MSSRHRSLAILAAALAICGLSALPRAASWRATGAIQPRLSPDGSSIAVSYQGAIWRLPRDGGVMRRLTSDSRWDSDPAWSPDGKRLATGSWDGTAKVWEAATGRQMLTLKGHTSRIYSLAWAPDGRHLVTGSDDNAARVWNAATGREDLSLQGHTSAVLSVAWAPDGERLATGSWDNTAKVWESGTGREVLSLKGHTRAVTSAQWAPDGKRLTTGSDDNTAIIWLSNPVVRQ